MYFYIPEAETETKRVEDEWRGDKNMGNHVHGTKLQR
jgi:hypothetical protein